jgi:hypothetical protein
MYACSASFLRNAGNQLLYFLTNHHHHICKLIYNDNDTRQGFQFGGRLIFVLHH